MPTFSLKRLFAFLSFCFAADLHAAKPAWKPITPEELAETSPRLEADAPAEILIWNVEVDDRNFPQERKTTEYIRYKIFAPDKVDAITRISGIEVTGSSERWGLHARLVLPDGTTREFGKEAIKERPLVQQAKGKGLLGWLAARPPAVIEKFLVIGGVERGAVLEYRVVRRDYWPGAISFFIGQRESTPVRRFDYSCRLSSNKEDFRHRTFVTNSKGARLLEDPKARTVTIEASNLPSSPSSHCAGRWRTI